MRRIGIVCVGKDCPGINAAVRAATRRAFARDMEVMGIRAGFEGLLAEDLFVMNTNNVAGILNLGGTILGMSKLDPMEKPDRIGRICRVLERYHITALIVMGGHTALGASMRLADEGIANVFVPCTIDNDIAGTDLTVGFLSAAGYVMEALDRLHSDAQSGHRVLVVEVRGDAAGWVATLAGMAGGADFVLTGGVQGSTIDQLDATIERRHRAGKAFSIAVVEAGYPLPEPLGEALAKRRMLMGRRQFFGGAGLIVAEHLVLKHPHEVRFVAISDVQRGGQPHVLDRVLATRLGFAAAEAIKNGKTNILLGVRGLSVVSTPYHPDLLEPKRVSQELFDVASAYF